MLSPSNPAILAAFAVLLLLIGGCGFEPVYGVREQSAQQSAASEQLARTSVQVSTPDPIHRRLAQVYKGDLEDLLNPRGGKSRSAEYALHAVLNMIEQPVAISSDGTVSRYNLLMDAHLRLLRVADNAVVYEKTVRRIGSYNNVSNAFYSTYVSSEDTKERSTRELAEDTRTRLASFFAQNPNPQPLKQQKPAGNEVYVPPTPLPDYNRFN